jgi:phosphatidylglycerophosphatase A
MSKIIDTCAVTIATWFGSGYAPKAPGTVGTLASLPFVWIIAHFVEGNLVLQALSVICITVTALLATARTEAHWKLHDDPRIVIDEVAGITAALVWFPFDWMHVTLGFIIFRTLDIWKPWPIGYIDEEIPGAAGTVLDDVLAGLATGLALYLTFHLKH